MIFGILEMNIGMNIYNFTKHAKMRTQNIHYFN